MVAALWDEHTLVRGLRAQDAGALEALMGQYEARVFSVAWRITGNREDAEEVLQDVFLAVVQKIDTFRGDAKLSTWMYRIATNAALMKLRRRPKVQAIPLEEELGPKMTEEGAITEPVMDWTRLPPDALDRKELAQRLEAAGNLLPEEYRSVFVLRDIEGLSAAEACEILGISVSALKSRLHRARLFLRKQLTEYAKTRPPRRAPRGQRAQGQTAVPPWNPGSRHEELP